MTYRPILFSAPMVRALLASSKTQTRRVVKPQPTGFVGGPGITLADGSPAPLMPLDETIEPYGRVIRCPYGQPGDRLWVREAWSAHKDEDHLPPRDCSRDIRFYEVEHGRQRGLNPRIGKLRPSMFMPRWHSRITLEVTAVRVERLQGISEADAQAEGLHYHDGRGIGHSGWREGHGVGFVYDTAREAYADLWQSINGPGSWDANPWVWVVKFKRVTP